ncbi:hypothetical protein CERSUDRAFT_73775 [Gelatoporia subvermispora B]|uniref:GPI ethanolamine phosphate transferase 3 n=1 Tax=Ceriporiopsis subvermispora (strain B) TaxID=914234 RepID=M2QI55_CERS8|nr:hypothetical protein CERSUDRAFT_73775 [Gelatoporia subvermispora B]
MQIHLPLRCSGSRGLTTDSLPTFTDMGSNFSGTAILEDSLISQLVRAGNTIAFMGDDIWTTVFPDAFDPSMRFPTCTPSTRESSHTSPTSPLPRQPAPTWGFIIGHVLGVDHVGHRVDPDHPTMHAKLSHMDSVLQDAAELLDDEALLVLPGSHCMDKRGDHGGDGARETSAAVWPYGKGAAARPRPRLRYTHTRVTRAHASLPGCDHAAPRRAADRPRSDARPAPRPTHPVQQPQERHSRTVLARVRGEGEGDRIYACAPAECGAGQGSPARARPAASSSRCSRNWSACGMVLMGLGLVLLAMGITAGVAMFLKSGQVKEKWEEWAVTTQARLVRELASGAVIGFLVQFPLR